MGSDFLLEITWVQWTKTDGIFSHVSISGRNKTRTQYKIKYIIIHCIRLKKKNIFSRNLLLNAKNDTIFDHFDSNREMKERNQIYFWKENEYVFLGIWIDFEFEANKNKTIKYFFFLVNKAKYYRMRNVSESDLI